MTLATYTITGNVRDLLGEQVDVTRVRAWVESSLGDTEVIYDRYNNRLLLGDRDVSLSADGSFTISGLIGFSNLAADVSPTGLQYRVWIAYPLARRRELATWNSGWMSIDASGDLSDLAPDQYVPPAYQGELLAEIGDYLDQITALRDQTAALRDEAAGYLIAQLDVTDGQVALLLDSNSDSRAAAVQLVEDELLSYLVMGVL